MFLTQDMAIWKDLRKMELSARNQSKFSSFVNSKNNKSHQVNNKKHIKKNRQGRR